MKIKPSVLRWTGNSLILIALGLAGWLAWLHYGSDVVASNQHERLVAEVREELSSTAPPSLPSQESESAETPVVQAAPSLSTGDDDMLSDDVEPQSVDDEPAPMPIQGESGEAFGVITVPRFGDDYEVPLLFDTDTETLKHGVGHYSGTGAPCAVGNFGLAGHRTTYGRPFHDIDRLQPGDEIVIETVYGSCAYEVDSYEIVDPYAVDVIAPVPNQPGVEPTESWLTMTACHPKYSDAQRYIVFARLVETN